MHQPSYFGTPFYFLETLLLFSSSNILLVLSCRVYGQVWLEALFCKL